MITEQLIWFIDSRFYYQNTSLDKIVQLANTHHKNIKIIIDASTQLTGRGYWHLLGDNDTLSNELMTSIEAKKAQMLKYLGMNAIKADISINQSADYLASLNTQVTQSNNAIVVIEDHAVAKRHPIFQLLTDINAPVLLLNKKAWKHPIKMLAAVDPLHEHARPRQIDDDIVLVTKNWAKNLEANWSVAHCYYVAPVLTSYKNKVRSMHAEGFSLFAKKLRLVDEQCFLLEGVPEDAMTSYINKHHIDILTMGIVARNKLEQLWIGSTTTALLNELPCDLLLIKE
ncbi:universal stress protein [Pseudocolwellia sp. HL-MZ19]|uniref:universal stress protein n=1 Tax=unclassified Pseudocolwellia TaxID=2848178 RepID=UPI003CE90B65